MKFPAFRAPGPRRTLVIAEVGTAHGGDAALGEELAAAAVEAGADCVKFQHVYADEIIHPATGAVPLPGGPVALYERFRSVETGPGFLGRMKEAVEGRGAAFLCTPFGPRSAAELAELGVSAMKVASPELNYAQLLEQVAAYGLPTILSTGVSRLADIEAAVERFAARGYDGSNLALLHCVTAYPAPEADYNLRLVPALSALFGIPVGVSDHSAHPLLVPALSALSGSFAVEKHICLSRSGDGLDDPIALPPDDFRSMVRAIRGAEALGAAAGMAAMVAEHGRDAVEAILGDGIKRLAASERANYERTNRSLHARVPIAEGEAFTEANVAVLRTEKVLRPGLPPGLLPVLLGRRAARSIPDGEGVTWRDVG